MSLFKGLLENSLTYGSSFDDLARATMPGQASWGTTGPPGAV
jgi:hypothetical protein